MKKEYLEVSRSSYIGSGFSDSLKKYMRKKKIKVKYFASKSKISSELITEFRNGQKIPTYDFLIKTGEILELSDEERDDFFDSWRSTLLKKLDKVILNELTNVEIKKIKDKYIEEINQLKAENKKLIIEKKEIEKNGSDLKQSLRKLDNIEFLVSKISNTENIRKEISSELTVRPHNIGVIATMSSGKSTLINALLGEEVLPNENQACTAKIFKIIDNDTLDYLRIKAVDKNGENNIVTKEELKSLNSSKEITEILIEGNFKGIKNRIVDKNLHQLCLIDTPGPNNSLDINHKEIAFKLIENSNLDKFLYVLNATQLGVNDDKKLLLDLFELKKSSNKDFEIIFILNKMDEIDFERENPDSIIDNVKKYLNSLGIKDPKVIPVSAYAAKIFKLALNNQLFTRREKNDFNRFYDLISRIDISKRPMEDKIDGATINVNGSKYSRNNLLKKIYSTGIIDVEIELERSLKSIENLKKQ